MSIIILQNSLIDVVLLNLRCSNSAMWIHLCCSERHEREPMTTKASQAVSLLLDKKLKWCCKLDDGYFCWNL